MAFPKVAFMVRFVRRADIRGVSCRGGRRLAHIALQTGRRGARPEIGGIGRFVVVRPAFGREFADREQK